MTSGFRFKIHCFREGIASTLLKIDLKPDKSRYLKIVAKQEIYHTPKMVKMMIF